MTQKHHIYLCKHCRHRKLHVLLVNPVYSPLKTLAEILISDPPTLLR